MCVNVHDIFNGRWRRGVIVTENALGRDGRTRVSNINWSLAQALEVFCLCLFLPVLFCYSRGNQLLATFTQNLARHCGG